MISLTMSRETLELGPLVITDDPFAGAFHIPEDGVGRPSWQLRKKFAPVSAYLPGKQLLAAVVDQATLPVTVYAHADTTAALQAAMDLLDAAASQWAYTVTLEVDGVSRSWPAECEFPLWEDFDSGMVRAYMARCQLVIPVNP